MDLNKTVLALLYGHYNKLARIFQINVLKIWFLKIKSINNYPINN